MKYIIKKGLLLFTITSLFFSCIRKKDFELSKVKWDDITPAWGLPLVNSTLTIDQALNKNNSSLIIQRDLDGFITFIYLDTVYSPNGSLLLDKFKLLIPTIHEGISIGTIPLMPPPNTSIPNLPVFNGTFEFVLDSVESIKKITFKDGLLKIQPKSLIKHNLSFKLTIPNLKNAFGTPFSTQIELFYKKPTIPTLSQQIQQKLNGYSISPNGGVNTVGYIIDNLKITTLSDAGTISNPIASSDSITVDISFEDLLLKSIEGKMAPIHLTGIPSGETVINAFDNALSGNISFEDPSINFTFENSFGLSPKIRIDSARMQYAYSYKYKDLKVNSSLMEIPGLTTINPATTLGMFTKTPTIIIGRSTSNIVDVLQGAPNKFVYKIGSIGLSSGTNDAFISDDSQIKINTEVKIPLFGAVKQLVISDTAKSVEMINADNVDYIEFRVGSDNSIPTSVQLQAYFCDTNLTYFDIVEKKKKYVILDSLVSPESAGIVVAPGDIEELDNSGNIIKTKINSFSTKIPVSREKYSKISTANVIIIKGTMFTKESENNKNVKFFTWQTCTFRLAAFAKLRINPGSPEDIINVK